MVANIDIAPTILELTGARPTASIDGRSLVRFWGDASLRSGRPIRLESHLLRRPDDPPLIRGFDGAVLGPYKLVVHDTGERELYDLGRDPHEIHNRARAPSYLGVRRFMERQVERLARCAGASCRRAAGPIPRPQRPGIGIGWAGDSRG